MRDSGDGVVVNRAKAIINNDPQLKRLQNETRKQMRAKRLEREKQNTAAKAYRAPWWGLIEDVLRRPSPADPVLPDLVSRWLGDLDLNSDNAPNHQAVKRLVAERRLLEKAVRERFRSIGLK